MHYIEMTQTAINVQLGPQTVLIFRRILAWLEILFFFSPHKNVWLSIEVNLHLQTDPISRQRLSDIRD